VGLISESSNHIIFQFKYAFNIEGLIRFSLSINSGRLIKGKKNIYPGLFKSKQVSTIKLLQMGKKCFLLCLIFMQFCIINYGQKGYKAGYIINNELDTLRGFIRLKSNSENSGSCDFIAGKNQPAKIYSPNDIRAYRIENSKYYVSKNIMIDSSRQRVFIEYLVDGIVNLFYYKGIGTEYYFIEKDTLMIPLTNKESIITVKEKGVTEEYDKSYSHNSNQYKRILQYLFQESPEVLKEIPSTAFDYRPLIKITKDYHNSVCKDHNCIDFTKSTNKSLYLEPYFGIINSWMGLKTSKNSVHDIKPYLGMQLRLKPFKGFSMWNMLVGINYSTNNFEGEFENTLNQYRSPYWIHTKYSIFRIPITVEYTLQTEKLQPFFSLSYNNILLSNAQNEILKGREDSQTAEFTYFRKYQFGASLGLGLKYNLSKNTYIYLKSEFEYRIPGANFGYVLDQTNVFSNMINIGYGFKIK